MNIQDKHPLWYRVAEIKPQLVVHAEIQKQRIRGETWYVLSNRVAGRTFRFTPRYYQFLALFDGKRSIEELWAAGVKATGAAALSQHEVMDLLARLYFADVLRADTAGDDFSLFERRRRQQRAKRLAQVKNPLAIAVPLIDPDRFLRQLEPLAAIIFSLRGLVACWTLILAAVVTALSNWDVLVSGDTPQILSNSNLLILAFVYPCIKALHELAHGLATRHWGGEVHQAGIMLMAFIPLPFVDASAAGMFPEKHRRIIVSGAGIMTELSLASVALFLWLAVEPGMVRDIAWNVMLIGGVSTLLFNGNPLLKFDAYYILSDAIGIPNLANRSTQYLGYLIKRHLFNLKERRSPLTHPSEGPWLLIYGTLAGSYRVVVLLGIALFVAETYPSVGLGLALWALLMGIAWPLLRQFGRLLSDPEYEQQRFRAIGLSAGIIGFLGGVILMLPIPHATMTEGVVIPSPDAEVRADYAGVFERFVAQPGAKVEAGQILIELNDPFIALELERLQAERRELIATRQKFHGESKQVEVQITGDKLQAVNAEITRMKERRAALQIPAPGPGKFLMTTTDDMPGRFVEKGELLGYVARLQKPRARAVVRQDDIDVVRSRTRGVSIRFADQLEKSYASAISRAVPGAVERLPSAALGALGGGEIAVAPDDEQGLKPINSVFELELAVPVPVQRLGTRVYVRFDHGSEPLGVQWYRRVRQLFLSRLDV